MEKANIFYMNHFIKKENVNAPLIKVITAARIKDISIKLMNKLADFERKPTTRKIPHMSSIHGRMTDNEFTAK